MAQERKDRAVASIRIVESILRDWDPIGVKPGVDAPADEYDSYAPHMVSLVANGCTPADLASHLESLCVNVMGLGSSNAAGLAHSRDFASRIFLALQPSNMRWSGPAA
jgi:hypothetical protein